MLCSATNVLGLSFKYACKQSYIRYLHYYRAVDSGGQGGSCPPGILDLQEVL